MFACDNNHTKNKTIYLQENNYALNNATLSDTQKQQELQMVITPN